MRKVLLSLVAISAIAIPALAGKYNKVISVGDKAPTFSGLPAVYNGEETSVSLSDLKEDVVVLVFLANHCPVVVGVRRPPDRLHQRLQGQGRAGGRHLRLQAAARQDPGHQGLHEGPQVQLHLRLRRDPGRRQGLRRDATPRSSSSSTRSGRSATPAPWTTARRPKSKVTKTYLRDAVDALLKSESPAVTETRAVGCGISYR